jgi:hypothetical protein
MPLHVHSPVQTPIRWRVHQPWPQPGVSRVNVITEREDDDAGEQDAEYQPLASGPARVIVIRTITR